MADFVAVIRRAVDNLTDNSPENRSRVYEKARGAVRRQLENMSPPPSKEVFQRQLDRLEEAIDEVEIEHTEALPAAEDNIDEALQFADERPETESRRDEAAVRPVPVPEWPVAAPPVAEPVQEPPSDAASEVESPDERWRAAVDEPVAAEPFVDEHEPGSAARDQSSPFGDEPLIGDAHDEVFGLGPASRAAPRKRHGAGRQLTLAAVIVVVLVGVAYALWDNRGSFFPMTAGVSSSTPPSKPEQTASAGKSANDKQAPETKGQSAAPLPADAGNKSTTPPKEEAKTGAADGGKYTQRLMADGTETNPGPAPAADEANQGEGRSVTEQTAEAGNGGTGSPQSQPGQASTAVANDTAAKTENAAKPAEISQKMYLYEERFKDQAPAAITGSVVWSLSKDTSDQSAKSPVIHGEISIPDKGITALVTIKRNNDSSLPASHLIEVVFALPGNFSGGGIESVERVSMKETEQARGDPLIAVPAKITDNFFMIALNDYPQAVKTNLNLLKTRNWIDIPITYTNGRRALITLQKGASGAAIFDKALKAWAQIDSRSSDSGSNAAGGATGGNPPAPNPTGAGGTGTPPAPKAGQ